MSSSAYRVRLETDLVGDRQLPARVRYGVHTLRAAESFARPQAQRLADVSELCRVFAMVKLAAARANREAGTLPDAIADVVEEATRELIDGRHGRRAHLQGRRRGFCVGHRAGSEQWGERCAGAARGHRSR